ncbi:hypothetical protein [Microbacterium foliorum]|uniref:hypothetical protein n=1 Tax=Microbacterium foliorum TaxID=104336 RepID=UPI001D872DE8|nr:hypothetical protein [Microbacterium foliorum]CAH0189573.1 hypothetical protein SRABI03_01702 [Microbacterium foliorum]
MLRLAASVTGFAALLFSIAGCGVMRETFSDRWKVQYRVETSAVNLIGVRSISFQYWHSTFRQSVMQQAPRTEADRSMLSGQIWTMATVVGAGMEARVEVEAAPVPLECSVILDGTTVIARSSAGIGGDLVCSANTPRFSER